MPCLDRKNLTNLKLKVVWYRQIKRLIPILLTVYLPAFGAILAVTIVSWSKKIPVSYFTRDVAATAGEKFYVGMYSKIGILLWCACTAICLFSYAVLKKDTRNRESVIFLLFSGLLTFILLIDDFFFLHEIVFPEYLHISENKFYLGYITIILLYLRKFFKIIIKTQFIFLILAFCFFCISILVDTIAHIYLANENIIFLFEDGAKLLGIVSWFTYFTVVCLSKVKGNILSLQVDSNN